MKKKKQRNAIFLLLCKVYLWTRWQAKKSEYGIYIEGLETKPVKDIHITDCNFENVEKEYFVKNTKDLHVDNTTVNGKKVAIK